jgi:YHS domain-containing protein
LQEFPIIRKNLATKIKKTIYKQKIINMKDSKLVTKDPICGMTVDEATALSAECDGKMYYFCCDHCRQTFLSTPAGSKHKGKSGCCCG